MDIESEVPALVLFMSIVLAAFQARNRFMQLLTQLIRKRRQRIKALALMLSALDR